MLRVNECPAGARNRRSKNTKLNGALVYPTRPQKKDIFLIFIIKVSIKTNDDFNF